MMSEDYALERQSMVEEQIVARGLHNPKLITAMGSIPRHRFIRTEDLDYAYADYPQPIGHGQTISQPYIVALMTELLELKSNYRVLEIGTGSGYQAAVLGRLVEEVHTVEIIPELAMRAEKTFFDLGYANIHVHISDGSNGWQEAAPYGGILVSAAAPSTPKPLLDQLSENGRMVIPVGDLETNRSEIRAEIRFGSLLRPFAR
jgi:protein-L-isoaspartate(D-aspartate) O-methyltransferase